MSEAEYLQCFDSEPAMICIRKNLHRVLARERSRSHLFKSTYAQREGVVNSAPFRPSALQVERVVNRLDSEVRMRHFGFLGCIYHLSFTISISAGAPSGQPDRSERMPSM